MVWVVIARPPQNTLDRRARGGRHFRLLNSVLSRILHSRRRLHNAHVAQLQITACALRTLRPLVRAPLVVSDYKRVKAAPKHRGIELLLSEVLKLLAADLPLLERHRDHPLTDEWKDHRDCHIKLALVLIYRKPDDEVLQLVRLGSHSGLGL